MNLHTSGADVAGVVVFDFQIVSAESLAGRSQLAVDCRDDNDSPSNVDQLMADQ